MPSFVETLETLSRASRLKAVNPYSLFDWPERLDGATWFMAPELISLHGSDRFAQLDEAAQRTLSFHELTNFFSLLIHGERMFIEKIVRYLYVTEPRELTSFIHHFLDEENKHMVYFGEFCMRYAGKVYPDRHLASPRRYDPGEEEVIFFGSVLIFEKLGDYYNIAMSRDERLHPLVRRINLYHHREEARHLVFGQQVVRHLFARFAPGWSAATRERVQQHMSAFITAAWREYFNPDVYADAGLAEPYDLREEALTAPAAQARFAQATAGAVLALREIGLLPDDPSPY